jgi:hypothetical protein
MRRDKLAQLAASDPVPASSALDRAVGNVPRNERQDNGMPSQYRVLPALGNKVEQPCHFPDD